jgi:hypothetical protein
LLFCLAVLDLSCGTRSPGLFERNQRSSLFSNAIEVAVPSPDSFSFAAVGDLHIAGSDTARLERILSSVTAEGDSFILLLGDIVDKGDEQSVRDFREAIRRGGFETRAFAALGNHDIFDNGWEYFEKYNGPGRYTIHAGNSRIIVLDTADGAVGEEQNKWLNDELGLGSFRHTFLASHYLPIVPNIRTYLKLSNDREALRLMTLASKSSVRAWLGAHYHSFVRGRISGVDYIVAGGGGGRRMPPVLDYFFVQVRIDNDLVSYEMRPVP